MRFSYRNRRSWIRRLALGAAIAAVAVPSTAQAMGVGGGPRPVPGARAAVVTDGLGRPLDPAAIRVPVTDGLGRPLDPAANRAPVSDSGNDTTSTDWRTVAIGLSVALAAFLAAIAGVGIARRYRKPAHA
jgi:hypothetical protein